MSRFSFKDQHCEKILFAVLFILCLFVVFPYFNKGYFKTHDGEWAVVRLAEMGRELKDGQIPPRWSDFLNHGFGYPLFEFTYPFPYYLGSIFRYLDFGLVDSIKLIFVISVFLSSFFMYFFAKELFGSIYSGFIASLFYTLFPYRLVNLYVRGSIGETLSLVFFPLIFLLCFRLFKRPNLTKTAFLSLSFAVLILTHNVMALLFLPFLILFILACYLQKSGNNAGKSIRYAILSVTLGLGVSAYFFFPAVFEIKYIALSQQKLADLFYNFLTPSQLLLRDYVPAAQAALGFGINFWLAAFISIFLFLRREEDIKRIIFIFLILSLVCLSFLTNQLSYFLWSFPPLSFVDFPWRTVNIISFFLSLLIGMGVKGKRAFFVFLGLGLITIISIFYFLSPEKINRPDIFYLTNDATTTSADELTPIWVKDRPEKRYQEKVEISDGKAKIANLNYNSKRISFKLTAQSEVSILINSIFYPGWIFRANGQALMIDYSNDKGLVTAYLPRGEYEVLGEFSESNIRKIADIISLFSLAVIMFFVSKEKLLRRR